MMILLSYITEASKFFMSLLVFVQTLCMFYTYMNVKMINLVLTYDFCVRAHAVLGRLFRINKATQAVFERVLILFSMTRSLEDDEQSTTGKSEM